MAGLPTAQPAVGAHLATAISCHSSVLAVKARNHYSDAIMMDERLTPLEKFERKEPLKKVIADRFMECLRSHGSKWGLPAMEAVADSVAFYPRGVSVRIFDLKGDGEVRDPSPALREALEEFHAVCASHGEDWGRALMTLILSPDRKTGQFQWEYTYPH